MGRRSAGEMLRELPQTEFSVLGAERFRYPVVMASSPLSRYHRQMILPGIGAEGQARLGAGHAMIVGCGALGTVVADLLARAGVGRLSIVDRDVVERTNLQRQVLFDERDAAEAMPKAEAARRRLMAVNSEISIHAIVEDFSPENAEQLVRPHPTPTVLIDGTDNFETRYLINDVAVKLSVPYVYGGAVGTGGMSMSILPGMTACLRCVFPEPPPAGAAPTCDTAGIWGPVSAMVGAAQAADAMKIIVGRTDLLSGTLLSFDAWRNSSRQLDLRSARRADCPCCGGREFEYLAGRHGGQTRVLCGRNSVQVIPRGEGVGGFSLGLADLAARLARHGEFALTEHTLAGRFSGERSPEGFPLGITVFADGRAIVSGTTDAAVARGIYSRYVGG